MDKKTMGKKSRQAGARFELKVREDLEKQGFIVAKWSNNVEFHNDEGPHDLPFTKGKLVKVKNKFLGPGRPMMLGAGFPDFIAFFKIYAEDDDGKCLAYMPCYEIMGVESKMRGILDKAEKQKCKWLLDNNIFSKIVIAHKGEKRGEISYKEFNT
ncbi:MAG TPA: hypothetical protein VMV95_02580 [Bacillota bacterium]|nr:hypothetical protein [Bacillota bacterium]